MRWNRALNGQPAYFFHALADEAIKILVANVL
jgi:hypothetical protein